MRFSICLSNLVKLKREARKSFLVRRAGKLENLKREMMANNLGTVGQSEMRWERSGEMWSGDVKG